jgi:hypothetical protein
LNQKGRRGSNVSNDSLNFRDSSFDPMDKSRKGKKESSLNIQPIAVDPLRELGKGLGQI